jgi:hypothetical protein
MIFFFAFFEIFTLFESAPLHWGRGVGSYTGIGPIGTGIGPIGMGIGPIG